jgi:chromosome segregation ATPase
MCWRTDQITECAQYIQELQAKVDAAQAAAEHQRDDLDTFKAELDAKRDEMQRFRKKERGSSQAELSTAMTNVNDLWICSRVLMTLKRKQLTMTGTSIIGR